MRRIVLALVMIGIGALPARAFVNQMAPVPSGPGQGTIHLSTNLVFAGCWFYARGAITNTTAIKNKLIANTTGNGGTWDGQDDADFATLITLVDALSATNKLLYCLDLAAGGYAMQEENTVSETQFRTLINIPE